MKVPQPASPEQMTFVLPDEAVLLADLSHLRQLVAEITARYRPTHSLTAELRPTVGCPADVVRLVGPEMELLAQEQLWVIVLTAKNAVIDIVRLYTGTLTASAVRIAELFRPAIALNAAS